MAIEVRMYSVRVDQLEDHMTKWCENNSRHWFISSPPNLMQLPEAERIMKWWNRDIWFDDENDKLMFILNCL